MRLSGVIASLAIHGLALTGLGLLDRPASSNPVAPAVELVVISESPPAPVVAALAPDPRPTLLTNTAAASRSRRSTVRRVAAAVALATPIAKMAVDKSPADSPVAVPAADDNRPTPVPAAIGPAVVSAPQPVAPNKAELSVPVRPRLLPPGVAEGQLLINPQDERYRPVIPPSLRRAGVRATPLLKVCVSEAGTVQSVTVLQASDAVLDPLIVAKVKTYLFRPSLHEGRPVPFCYAREFKLIIE
jgi:hypothetical protein